MTSEQIKQQIAALRPQLDGSDPKQILEQMRDLDKQLTQAKRSEMLERVNAEQTRKRELAAKVWECEEPAEDITTNGGSFHKSKVKKYPIIAALNYAHAKWEDGRITEFIYNGERFYMYKKEYKSNEPNKYTRPDSFEEFLKLNNLMVKPLTIEEFATICDKLTEAKKELQAQIEAYQNKLDALNYYPLSCWRLIGQQPQHVYTYTENR